jgi:hypothetical protein
LFQAVREFCHHLISFDHPSESFHDGIGSLQHSCQFYFKFIKIKILFLASNLFFFFFSFFL